MKLNGILNSQISKGLSDLGHTDLIAIGDCGLPIANDKKIDISLKLGVPSFIDVLEEVLKDFSVEKYILASEIKTYNANQDEKIKQILAGVDYTYISHEEFKEKLKDVKFVIRTGENTPYSNIILQAKNIF
ncbi:MAG: D-ribose pyranase [Peptoniphilaceae bacterium]|nr:D-ribose pyranase [Peptoniphilaceae bacterium]MDY6018472.1 D-ribose pyranase [Anaerococcus sp.]